MKTIDDIFEDSFKSKDFYKDQVTLFKKKEHFFNVKELDMENLPKIVKKFYGVFIILDKDDNLIRATSHGEFKRKKGIINEKISPSNPIVGARRWTPIYADIKLGKIGLNFNQRSAIKFFFGIDLNKNKEEPSPKEKVYKLLSKTFTNQEIQKMTPAEKRTKIKNKVQPKNFEEHSEQWDKIFPVVYDVKDLNLHMFYIEERSPFTPTFFKEAIINFFEINNKTI